MGWSKLGIVPVVLIAAMFILPAAVTAKNNSTGGDNAPMGVLCGHLYDATSGELISGGSVMILEIIVEKWDYPLFDMVYDGYYEFTKVPEGVYTLRASDNSYEVLFREGVEVVRNQVTVEDFVLRRTGQVSGFAMDAVTKTPIADAYAYLVGTPDYVSHYTSSEGGFTLYPVLPGTYTLKIEKAGYETYTYPYPVVVNYWQTTSLYWLYMTPV